MSDQRVAAITSHLDRFLKTFGLFLGCVVGLSGCPKLLCDLGVVDDCGPRAAIDSSWTSPPERSRGPAR